MRYNSMVISGSATGWVAIVVRSSSWEKKPLNSRPACRPPSRTLPNEKTQSSGIICLECDILPQRNTRTTKEINSRLFIAADAAGTDALARDNGMKFGVHSVRFADKAQRPHLTAAIGHRIREKKARHIEACWCISSRTMFRSHPGTMIQDHLVGLNRNPNVTPPGKTLPSNNALPAHAPGTDGHPPRRRSSKLAAFGSSARPRGAASPGTSLR
jgi:hypothetical protein